MQCPICADEKLVMTERQGIEIDYGPGCRGVWLDRGELDKIIERSAAAAPSQAKEAYLEPGRPSGDYRYHKKKRGGLLGELFDF